MIDINVLYDEDHPEGYPDTLKCIEESKSSVNVFIDYFLQIDKKSEGKKLIDVEKEFDKFDNAIKNIRKIEKFKKSDFIDKRGLIAVNFGNLYLAT